MWQEILFKGPNGIRSKNKRHENWGTKNLKDLKNTKETKINAQDLDDLKQKYLWDKRHKT